MKDIPLPTDTVPPSDFTPAQTEAARLMTVCNSCRYCEGLCAVFPAMELHRDFSAGTLDHLASLCHSCGACYHDCQFAPPHEFSINVPQALARLRTESYARHAWPAAAGSLIARGGLTLGLGTVAAIAALFIGLIMWNAPGALLTAGASPKGFYALMPHGAMVVLFGLAFFWALLATAMGARNFWRAAGTPTGLPDHLHAAHDAARLTYLDGGGVGCYNADDQPTDRRRLWHHLTFYGFLLCFAATSVATLYHYLLGREAPYPWWDLPGLLGILGGIGLVVGTAGLWQAKSDRLADLKDPESAGLDRAFIAVLFLLGLTGLLLRFLGETPVMGPMLALHLGTVLAFFLLLPYSKMVHGLYRYLALARYARDKH